MNRDTFRKHLQETHESRLMSKIRQPIMSTWRRSRVTCTLAARRKAERREREKERGRGTTNMTSAALYNSPQRCPRDNPTSNSIENDLGVIVLSYSPLQRLETDRSALQRMNFTAGDESRVAFSNFPPTAPGKGRVAYGVTGVEASTASPHALSTGVSLADYLRLNATIYRILTTGGTGDALSWFR